jgi:hypothetical protein
MREKLDECRVTLFALNQEARDAERVTFDQWIATNTAIHDSLERIFREYL